MYQNDISEDLEGLVALQKAPVRHPVRNTLANAGKRTEHRNLTSILCPCLQMRLTCSFIFFLLFLSNSL